MFDFITIDWDVLVFYFATVFLNFLDMKIVLKRILMSPYAHLNH